MADTVKPVRHVLGLSGGKDSAALAIYLREQGRVPEMEYFFCDTGAELPEVYSFINRLEDYLGKKVERLDSGRDFDHHLKLFGGYLPSPRQRWCTREMKIKPFERFIKEDEAISYIGIRADENREGYISTKKNIKPAFPFIQDGIVRDDVFHILEESVGVPEYYRWRKRSGCYFCFFQQRQEWLGLKREHPELFEAAKGYENQKDGYTWVRGLTLDELVARAEQFDAKDFDRHARNRTWQEILRQDCEDDDPEEQACLICSL
ncbi:phosphoadenosine phosphosulfate reductase family protein [Candidatus Thiosymbion oneisti]|uniref:phosphoadenosine phosphosulfate reductase family protein n=1 Tax=Candidatus Thiosymbion oneisti TaxID=589554 RepID=UPI000B2376BF|nr:phosphoadenosine phosphosulfate reductase family protein [Candidatus Thiosymbion oneisti]